jgi:hypothetical protein
MATSTQAPSTTPLKPFKTEPNILSFFLYSFTICSACNRGAQTTVFELDIRISNPPYIDVCQSLASETGLKSRNVEKRINAV